MLIAHSLTPRLVKINQSTPGSSHHLSPIHHHQLIQSTLGSSPSSQPVTTPATRHQHRSSAVQQHHHRVVTTTLAHRQSAQRTSVVHGPCSQQSTHSVGLKYTGALGHPSAMPALRPIGRICRVRSVNHTSVETVRRTTRPPRIDGCSTVKSLQPRQRRSSPPSPPRPAHLTTASRDFI